MSAATAACGAGPQPAAGIPPRLLAQARAIGHGPRFRPPARGPVPGACRRTLGMRTGAHVEVFAANRVVLVAAGIGARPPLRRREGRIVSAACFGALTTLEPTGVVLLRPGTGAHLSTLFRAWGQPLSATRVASFPAGPHRVEVYLDGRRWRGAPGAVPLRPHAEIVLEVGPHVPPHTHYTFPPGA